MYASTNKCATTRRKKYTPNDQPWSWGRPPDEPEPEAITATGSQRRMRTPGHQAHSTHVSGVSQMRDPVDSPRVQGRVYLAGLGAPCTLKAVRAISLVAEQKIATVTMPHAMTHICVSKQKITLSVTYQSRVRVSPVRIAKHKSPPWLQARALIHSGTTPRRPAHLSATYHSHKMIHATLGMMTRRPTKPLDLYLC
jgi:hypothetical protein